jgi:hypothetical protein
MGLLDALKALKALTGLQAITKAMLESVGQQAYQRALVAQLILQGKSTVYSFGAMWVDEVPYPCGFLNKADAKDFVDRLLLHRANGTQILNVVSYSENPDYYRLDGWVKTIVPPRCNAYYYDWDNRQLKAIRIDLGAINSKL